MPHTVKIDDWTIVNVPGFGAMGMSQVYGKAHDEESKEVLQHAIDIGCTFWNTATIYGEDQHNEKLIGSVLRREGNREKVFLTTKWGLKPTGMDGSAEFAQHCIDQSIDNLGSAPDAWLLHRIDPNTPVEVSVQAMEDARKAGKTRFIGLSAMSAATLRRAAKVARIDFVEMEFSPFETGIERSGVLDACKELGVKVFAYSPLGSGILTGRFRSPDDFKKQEGDFRANGMFPRLTEEHFLNNFKLVKAFEEFAQKKGCTSGQLALAWVSQVHGDVIIPIPGTKSAKYVDENFASRDVVLSTEDLASIRALLQKYPITGQQLSEQFMKTME